MATFATPGIDINRGRIVHLARSVISICENFVDDTPIFISRLVEESGDNITGGRATAGNRPASAANRSCTSWRARIRSVPDWKISTTDDNPSTDFERIVFTHGVPLSAFSIGIETRLSTSSVD